MEVITNKEQFDKLIEILNEPVIKGLNNKIKREYENFYNLCLQDTPENLFKIAMKISFYNEFLYFIEQFLELDGINYFGIEDTLYLLKCENLTELMYDFLLVDWKDFTSFEAMTDLVREGIIYLKENEVKEGDINEGNGRQR